MKLHSTAIALCVLCPAEPATAETTGPRVLQVRSTAEPLSPITTSADIPASRDYLADPEILHHDGTWYMYGTTTDSANFTGEPNVGLGVRCYSSPDLVTWKDEGLALDAANDAHSSYTRFLIWSPHVIYAHGSFYMFYNAVGTEYDEARSAGRSLGGSHFQRLIVARSESPKGPSKEHAAPLFTGKDIPGYVDGEKGVVGVIDAFVYADVAPASAGERIRYYLYWSGINDEKNENLLWGAELRPDFKALLLPPDGEAPRMVLGKPMQEWEKRACGDRRILEAPSIMRRGGVYYLLYSANSFNTIPYGVGYATSRHPLGPYTRASDKPVLSAGELTESDYPLSDDQLVGPAGASFVPAPGDEQLITFAAIESRTTVPLCSNDVGHARRPYLTRFRIADDGKLSIGH